jgi:hypothetical protein
MERVLAGGFAARQHPAPRMVEKIQGESISILKEVWKWLVSYVGNHSVI